MLKYFFAFFLLLSCAELAQYRVSNQHDDFSRDTVIRMRNNFIGNPIIGGYVKIGAIKLIQDDTPNESKLGIIVEYSNIDWMFIAPGKSLIFLIDGNPVELYSEQGSSPNRDVKSGTSVVEKAAYDCTPEILISLSNASSVRYKLIGSKYYTEGSLSQTNLDRFKKFCLEYCP